MMSEATLWWKICWFLNPLRRWKQMVSLINAELAAELFYWKRQARINDLAGTAWMKQAIAVEDERAEQVVRIRSLEHDHKVMREALKRYANEANWLRPDWSMYRCEWNGRTNGSLDARTALSSLLVKDGE